MPTHSLYLTNSTLSYVYATLNQGGLMGQDPVVYKVTIPSAPVFNTVTGNNTITLNFSAGNNYEIPIITDYQYSLDNGNTFYSLNSLVSPYTISGLTNGNTYQIQMKALNADGYGTASVTQSVLLINITTGLVFYLPFDTNSVDSISQTNYTTQGTLTINSSIQKVGAGCLDVTTNRIYNSGLNMTQFYNVNNTLSISFWIQLISTPTSPVQYFWVLRTSSQSSGLSLASNNAGSASSNLYFVGRTDNGATVRYASMLALSSSSSNFLNTWRHLAWVINGTYWTVYVDGVQTNVDISFFGGSSSSNQTTPYNVGYNLDFSVYNMISYGLNPSTLLGYGPCYIDDFRIYNRVLSPAEIQYIMSIR